MEIELKDILKVYECGIDYGLLIAEEERDSEDMFDGFICGLTSEKMCVPSMPERRRQPRSKEWRKTKKDATFEFLEICSRVCNNSHKNTGNGVNNE